MVNKCIIQFAMMMPETREGGGTKNAWPVPAEHDVRGLETVLNPNNRNT